MGNGLSLHPPTPSPSITSPPYCLNWLVSRWHGSLSHLQPDVGRLGSGEEAEEIQSHAGRSPLTSFVHAHRFLWSAQYFIPSSLLSFSP